MQNLPVFQQQQQWLNKLYIEPIMEEGINGWIDSAWFWNSHIADGLAVNLISCVRFILVAAKCPVCNELEVGR